MGDYEIAFPELWLGNWTPIAGLPAEVSSESLAPYRDRPLPRKLAEAVLVALKLHEDLPKGGIGSIAADIGLPRRSLQYALRGEGVSYREIVQGLCLRRAQLLLASTQAPADGSRAARRLHRLVELPSSLPAVDGNDAGTVPHGVEIKSVEGMTAPRKLIPSAQRLPAGSGR